MDGKQPIFSVDDTPTLPGRVTAHSGAHESEGAMFVIVAIRCGYVDQRSFSVRMSTEMARSFPVGAEVNLLIELKEQ